MRVIATAIALTLLLGGTAFAQEGDAAKGEKLFKKCKACHTSEQGAKNKIGPNLFGIV
ncbi:MAG: cytochrome c family protein, partial [Hyphomicrobiales bacterium]